MLLLLRTNEKLVIITRYIHTETKEAKTMAIHEHRLKRTADKHAAELRKKGLVANVHKRIVKKGYVVYTARK